jgi:lysophospholipase L1-like esterase
VTSRREGMLKGVVMRVRLVLACLVVTVLAAPSSAWGAPPLPSSIAAIGDSITRATDVCCWYGDHPAQSWSTGGGILDGISSHYERIRAARPSTYGRNYNDARSGAKMRDAELQAGLAVSQGAGYVTFLMGANDLCTSSPATMTSVTDFQTQFSAAMSKLAAGLPADSHVFVSSIPDLFQLWQLFRANSTAQFVWGIAGICQSMLSPANTDADRQAVVDRERAFNQVLRNVCSQYSFCLYDNDATFEFRFSAGDVSKLDYFHPSLAGQAKLASLTWQHSWWAAM